MKIRSPLLLFILGLLFSGTRAYSQKREIDSLKKVLQTAAHDTNKVNALNRLTWLLRQDSACLPYNEEAIRLSEKLQFWNGLSTAHNHAGVFYKNQSNYKNSVEHLTHAIQISTEHNNKTALARSYNNLSVTYTLMSNYPKALECNLKALQIRNELNDRDGMSACYNNIGSIYHHMNDEKKALEYYNKALEIRRASGDKKNYASALSNIGSVYASMHDNVQALAYYQKSLAIRTGLKDIYGIASACNNIGIVYSEENNNPKALEYFERSVTIKKDISDLEGLTISYNNIAQLYYKQGKCAEALRYSDLSLCIAREIESIDDIKEAEWLQSNIYECLHNYRRSLLHYKTYVALRDSIFNEENTKKIVQQEMNYEFERKEASARIEQEKKEALNTAGARRQRIILWAVSGFGILLLGFSVFAWRSFLQKQKINVEISRQKELIEEKQKEILDSIHYAKRIQTSLLPNEKYIERLLKNRLYL